MQFGKCIEFSRSKFPQKPILPLELCEYGPGKFLNMDLFEIGKKDFLTTTCKLSGLILGEKLANKSAEETCKKVESLFLCNAPPIKL